MRNLRQRPCYFDLVRYFFLNLSKTDISEIFRFLVFRRIEAEQENDQYEDDRDCAHGLFTCRKSLRQRWRTAGPATDSIRRTRRKRPSLSLSRSYLSSRSFLKLSKIDISENVIFSWALFLKAEI